MKRTMRVTIALLIISVFAFLFTGCSDATAALGSNEQQSQQTERMVADGRMQTGMPAIVNFTELKFAKMVYELRDSADLLCYAYLVNINGDLIFVGQCIGYGLPYSVQFSNPETIWMERDFGGSGGSYNDFGGTLPQPEPNGLFMPDGLSATWILLINPETGEPAPVYFEPTIVISPFPLHDIV